MTKRPSVKTKRSTVSDRVASRKQRTPRRKASSKSKKPPTKKTATASRKRKDIGRDVTELNKLDEAGRLVGERLILAVRASNIGIWELELPDGTFPHGRLVFTNVWEQLGYERPPLPTDFAAGISLVHPDDRPRQEEAFRSFLSGETPQLEFEVRLRLQDGGYRWMLVRGVAIRNVAGIPIYVIGTRVDITDRKRAEQQLRQSEMLLAEAQQIAHIGSWNWDLVNGDLQWSDEHYRVFRFKPQDPPITLERAWDRVHPEDRPRVQELFYQHSPRARAPFLALNCAAIPENLLESELFGHEKGAFTGADRRRVGKFEQCNGGTLFLDEIGDMPLALQAKLLRLLQEQAFERVGGNETIRTDVRLIAATNHNLKELSAAGKFRPDLYYRLSVFTIHLPALRQRGNDLIMLVQLFLRRFAPELGREASEVASETLNRLRMYSWPGNIRELQSVLKQALLLSSGEVLLSTHLPPDLFPAQESPRTNVCATRFQTGMTLADLECDAIQQTLFQTGGNRQQTAELLGISTRTLLRKIRSYGLNDPLQSSDKNSKLPVMPR